MLQLYANIKNPLWALRDYGDWHGKYVAERFLEDEMFEGEDYEEEINARLAAIADEMEDGPEADKALRELLKEYGFDGIKYENYFEGDSGDFSFIAFDSNQIKNTDNLNPTESDDIRYSISETIDGRKVAVVDDDILSGIDITHWDKATKKAAQKAAFEAMKKFGAIYDISGTKYIVNKDSRREYTKSNYTDSLAKKSKWDIFVDKMKFSSNIDDVLVSASNWEKDGVLKHERSDGYVDFKHGEALIMSGENRYSAEIVVAISRNGTNVFYDIVDINPTEFTVKEEAPTAVTTNKSPDDIHGASSEETVPQDSTGVNQKSDEIRNSESSDADYLDMIGADVSEVYEDLPELSDLINRQNAQTRGRVYSDASIRSAAAEILEAASAAVPEARRGELELMLRDAFVNWSRRGISAEEFMEQARKIGQWVIDNGKQAKGEADHLVVLKENVIIGKLIPAGSGLIAYRDYAPGDTPENRPPDIATENSASETVNP